MDLLIVTTAWIDRCALPQHRFYVAQAGLPYYDVHARFNKIANYGTAY